MFTKTVLVRAIYAFVGVFALEMTKTFRKVVAALLFLVAALVINAAMLVTLTVLVVTKNG